MILVNKQLDKFKDENGDTHIYKMYEAFPHLYDKGDRKIRDYYAEFDETNQNLIVETTIEDGTRLKEKTERFIYERRKFIAEEQKKINELTVKYNKQLIAMETMLSDRDLKEFTKADCCRTMYEAPADGALDNSGKVCIIPLDKLCEKYRKPEYQLSRVQSGFGVTPSASGNACYGYFCADGERCRWERYNFLGVANAEAEKIAEELEAGWTGGASGCAEKEREPDEPEM